jgi:DNA-nicking Smr family endonuclease
MICYIINPSNLKNPSTLKVFVFMPRKKPSISKEDLDAFQQAVKGVQPLKTDKIRLGQPPIAKKPVRKHEFSEEDNPIPLNESLVLDSVSGEEALAYKHASISLKTLRKLRKGQYNVEAKLDLHGMTVEKARKAVHDFLQECLREKIQVALIIHGKGHHSAEPVLKNKLNHWLRELPFLLAFCSAAQTHGSRGALYILLKRNTEETLLG